ncbi:MAG: YdcF family protein [Pseudomonadota bacterium]|nr:YdcF family protein [Pseudomonadota bacterium]MEE3295060.1 YdcF family protein [Pseudomonadota bacterium]
MKLKRNLKIITLFVFFLCLFTFTDFVRIYISSQSNIGSKIYRETIIVLTGGPNRITNGFDLLEKGHAKVMFISGVNPIVERADISRIVNPKNDKRRANLFACCVFLGKKSKDTKSNAEETLDWMISRDHSKALLVTSLEHMPRSIIEFHNNAPDIDIIPWPIIIKMHYKWYNPSNYKTIILEYLRYTVIRLKYIIV